MKKFIICVDLQKDFIDGTLGTKEAQNIVPKVVEYLTEARKDKDNIFIFTQDTHSEDYLKTAEGKKLPVKHCIDETDGWRINKDIAKVFPEYNFKNYDEFVEDIGEFVEKDDYEDEMYTTDGGYLDDLNIFDRPDNGKAYVNYPENQNFLSNDLSKHNVNIIIKNTFGNMTISEVIQFFICNDEKFDKDEKFEVEIFGLCTDICVVTNALILKTAMPEINITVLKDLCAGVTPETHECALKVMQMCQVNIK